MTAPGPESEPTAENLRARYGKPKMLDIKETAAALRRLDRREEVHPFDVSAFWYPSQEACDAFAGGNLRHHNAPGLGSFASDGGVIGVTDLRPQLAEQGACPTSPRKPDDRDGRGTWNRRKGA